MGQQSVERVREASVRMLEEAGDLSGESRASLLVRYPKSKVRLGQLCFALQQADALRHPWSWFRLQWFWEKLTGRDSLFQARAEHVTSQITPLFSALDHHPQTRASAAAFDALFPHSLQVPALLLHARLRFTADSETSAWPAYAERMSRDTSLMDRTVVEHTVHAVYLEHLRVPGEGDRLQVGLASALCSATLADPQWRISRFFGAQLLAAHDLAPSALEAATLHVDTDIQGL